MKWSSVRTEGKVPEARCCTSFVPYDDKLYIYGGEDNHNVHSNMYTLDLSTLFSKVMFYLLRNL